MKKYIIALSLLSISTLLVGCSSQQAQTLQTLESQLTRVESIVGNGNIADLSLISSNGTVDMNTAQSSLQTQKHISYQNMLQEDSLRNDITAICGCIKQCSKKDLKLTKSQTALIKQLSNNIARYTTSFEETESYTKSNANKILKNIKSNKELNLTETEGNYLSLGNNMNERYAYMSNIYSNLEKIYTLLKCDDCSDTNPPNPNQTCPDCDNNTEPQEKNTKNIDTFENTAKNKISNTNNTINPQNQAVFPNNCPNCPPNGYYVPPYYNQFNSGRNTDSFYPRMRNIDSYRQPVNYNGNFPYYQNYNYQPINY